MKMAEIVRTYGIHGVDKKIHIKASTVTKVLNFHNCETEMLSIFNCLFKNAT